LRIRDRFFFVVPFFRIFGAFKLARIVGIRPSTILTPFLNYGAFSCEISLTRRLFRLTNLIKCGSSDRMLTGLTILVPSDSFLTQPGKSRTLALLQNQRR